MQNTTFNRIRRLIRVKKKPSTDPSQRRFVSCVGDKRQGRLKGFPIALGGRRGVITSTEMEDGDTPLLISLAAQGAPEANLYPVRREWHLAKLGTKVPLYIPCKASPLGEA